MSLKGRSTIFESTSQRIDHVDPGSIRLLQDRVLLRDVRDPEMVGSIVIPETAREIGIGGNYRLGLVIAVGPGNQFTECGITDEDQVKRRPILSDEKCPACEGRRQWFSIDLYQLIECPWCYGYGKKPVTIPTECQPGDLVAYDRRKEAEFFINGDRHIMLYEEQAILFIIDREDAASMNELQTKALIQVLDAMWEMARDNPTVNPASVMATAKKLNALRVELGLEQQLYRS